VAHPSDPDPSPLPLSPELPSESYHPPAEPLSTGAASVPPGAWAPARRLLERARAPVDSFLAIEAASGILLVLVAALALLWANSPWRASYESLWHTPIALRVGPWAFERDLHFWINDALMTFFFFVVGLEIRREMHHGELSEARRAALPLIAAVGGMIMPALVYLAFNHGRPASVGWGVPMATDIAFAVGVLTLLGKRVAPALRILLLALAVIDDVGAILVIALFYSSDIQAFGFLVMGAGVLGILAMQLVGVRSAMAYVLPGAVVWAGTYAAGIHPTLAGVLVGLMTPVRAWLGVDHFIERSRLSVERYLGAAPKDQRELLPHLDELSTARREAVSPVDRLQHALHGWVAYGIMPLFALANAGVPLGNAVFDEAGVRVFVGIAAGLVVGKPLGIFALSWAMTQVRVVALPTGVGFSQVGLVGVVAGIGFTMALFVAQLAFPSGALLETAKLAIITGSVLAALLSVGLGRVLLPAAMDPRAAATAAEAEASTVS
jgi:Na+:H+ antiporter, NhaA family